MTTFHNYPQHPDAHPTMPWWRRTVTEISNTHGWQREPDGYFVADPEWGDDPPASWDDEVERTIVRLNAHDIAHPLPAPSPMCGQVWAYPPSGERSTPIRRLVLAEDDRHVLLGGAVTHWHDTERWPPPGAVLVAGPGAPWSPAGG